LASCGNVARSATLAFRVTSKVVRPGVGVEFNSGVRFGSAIGARPSGGFEVQERDIVKLPLVVLLEFYSHFFADTRTSSIQYSKSEARETTTAEIDAPIWRA
jgi:hypothetical protein